ncbi:MAG: glycogen synthase GlgA [Myxococcales bacterium]|nr:glycogen synthase GlgA [Myxococcales bacterium]
MKIVLAAAEAVPYAKVGGLGDVAGGLAPHLASAGHEVWLVLPKYEAIDYLHHGFVPRLEQMGVPTGWGVEWCKVHERIDRSGVRVMLVENHHYFSRPGLYGDASGGYPDNGFRFAFFSNAVLQLCRDLHVAPDVVHVHDWPTALIPALLKYRFADDPIWRDCGSVLTIHNLAYQGTFEASTLSYAGLPTRAMVPDVFEDNGAANFLKGAIAQADLLSTVSPTYAREILGHVGGCGLHIYLQRRASDLHGILNGVDDELWNPATDPHLPATYSAADLTGKALCKRALQEELGLDPDPGAPLFGIVSRMVEQKGLDLVCAALDTLVRHGAQVAVLGTGEPELEAYFGQAPAWYPGRVASYVGFSNRLAHRIEAGSDLFLMPSRFEPCGLNQIYSLRYGTPPVVRATGGLEDTVELYRPETESGTGFKFWDITVGALLGASLHAIDVYRRRPASFEGIVRRGMALRFTWEDAAQRYVQLYEWAREKRATWRYS